MSKSKQSFNVYFTVDFNGLRSFADTIRNDLRKRSNGPIREAIREWSVIYRRWLRQRFSNYSRGRGSWEPLAKSTVKKKGHSRILRDTDTLFRTLDPRAERKPGMVNRHTPFGIVVGYGSTGTHPKAKIPIDRLAQMHQIGAGKLPSRPIIVPPSGQVVKEMAEVMKKAAIEVQNKTRVNKKAKT